jgi:hypothetical protein
MLRQALRRVQALEAAASAAAASAAGSDTVAFLAGRAAASKADAGALRLCPCPAAHPCCSALSPMHCEPPLLTSPSLPPHHCPAAPDAASSWAQLRRLGAGFWLRDGAALAATAERLAKQQFASRRNADDCALLYAALGKRSVLQVCPGRRGTQQCC